MAKEISLTVYGEPRAKGNLKARATRDGRIYMHEPRGLLEWERLVRGAAQVQAEKYGLIEGPVAVGLRFYLLPPKNLPKRKPAYPTKRPDLDKLARACLDALRGVLIRDDSQVVRFDELSKDYASMGKPPRVEITIRALLPQE